MRDGLQKAPLVGRGPRPMTVRLYTSLKEPCATVWLKYSTVGSRWALSIEILLQQVMDKPPEATLVGQGPRPKTVKLAGA